MELNTFRYVVLHHTGWREDHFDLLLEASPDGLLESWRYPHWPPAAGDVPTANAPHRRLYLDYEGPVSNDRGNVRRVAAGVYRRHSSGDAVRILLQDSQIELLLPG